MARAVYLEKCSVLKGCEKGVVIFAFQAFIRPRCFWHLDENAGLEGCDWVKSVYFFPVLETQDRVWRG
jgi:hypothetical protein